MMGSVSILIIGSELLDGRVVDTNSNVLAKLLDERGIELNHVLSCTDDEVKIRSSLEFLLDASAVVILSGGLGPTTDDLTREAVSSFVNRPLEQSGEVLSWLEELYRQKKRTLDQSNIKQTYFPQGAKIIPNPKGTAAGFSVTFHYRGSERHLYALPGVPGELKRMVEQSVMPEVDSILGGRAAISKRFFRTFGLPEAAVGERIVTANLSPQTVISYRAHFPEIHVVLKNSDEPALISDMERAIHAVGVESIIANDLETPFEAVVQKLLLEQKRTIAVAESCTAGILGALLTNTPGSSGCFIGGVLSYSNGVKVSQLGVLEATLERFGAVSHETAQEMAQGIKRCLGSNLGVSITGIAGPEGGTATKPVGLFYVGLCSERSVQSFEFFFNASRYRIRQLAAYTALDVIRRTLQNLPINSRDERRR